jgi:hypothetical protein
VAVVSVVAAIAAAAVVAVGVAMSERDSDELKRFDRCMRSGGALRVTSARQLRPVRHAWADKRVFTGMIEFGSEHTLASLDGRDTRRQPYALAAIVREEGPATEPLPLDHDHRVWDRVFRDPGSASAVYLAQRPAVARPIKLERDCDYEINGSGIESY